MPESTSAESLSGEGQQRLATPYELLNEGLVKLTPEQEAEVDSLVDDKAFMYPDAVARVLNLSEVQIREIQGLPQRTAEESSQQAVNGKPSHPDGPVYITGHPIKVSQRVRTAGDANSGDPDLR